MDPGSAFAVAVGGLIALTTQAVSSRSARMTAEMGVDFERWEAWRREGADVWADVAWTAHELDRDYVDLAADGEEHLAALRARAESVARRLHRLTALTLSRDVSDWAAHLAPLFAELRRALPTHADCDDEDCAKRYQELRHLLHAKVDWNDGRSSTEVERLRDGLLRATEPPSRLRASQRRLRSRRWRGL